MQKRAWKDLESCQGEIVRNFKRTLEEAGGNQLSRCLGAPGKWCQAGRGVQQWQGWTRHRVVTHGLIPAGRGAGESPRGRCTRGALGVTSILNGVLPQKSLGFCISHNPSPRRAAQTVSPPVLPPGVFMLLAPTVFHN